MVNFIINHYRDYCDAILIFLSRFVNLIINFCLLFLCFEMNNYYKICYKFSFLIEINIIIIIITLFNFFFNFGI